MKKANNNESIELLNIEYFIILESFELWTDFFNRLKQECKEKI